MTTQPAVIRFNQAGANRREKFKNITRADRHQYDSGFNGGIVNPISGAGTSLDKNSLTFFNPTQITSKTDHEALYVESWAAAKFVDIPVNDMFVKWREFCDMENDTIELVKKAEVEFKIRTKLSKAMKSARLYGTGLFIILTKDARPELPLNINRMMPGDLANILTVDRFDATVVSKNNNPFSSNYSKPEAYRITLKMGGNLIVHHSRVIRFDGIKPFTDNSWQVYDQDWGVASIIPVITEIYNDSNIAKGVAHLVNEASIKNMKVEGFEDAIQGTGDGDMSLLQRMELTTRLMSLYRTNFMDIDDDFTRTEVSFAGLPDVMDRNATRLAAAADIPATRFWSKSAVGMQATGEGDARNYALKVASDQENDLPEPLDIIDKVMEKHLGLSEKICYKFLSLLDLSEADKVEIALKKSQTVVSLMTGRVIDEDEARGIIDGDEILGNFDDLGEPLPGNTDFERSLANIQIKRQQAEGASNG